MIKINLSEIIEKQPVQNVGCVGHVAHGKSTVVYGLTGIRTQKHSSELERNITINLGYANLRIYRNKKTNILSSSNVALNDPDLQLCKHYSFVDCPGHQAYMSTMVSGTETFDVALLLIAASEAIPQPQTLSHTNVLAHTNIENIAILFNKIDLLNDEKIVDQQLTQLNTFIGSNLKIQSKPIIPISAQKKINIDKILEFLISVPEPDMNKQINQPFRMNILRSFNINKISVDINDLKGGVIGGSIKAGYISQNDWVIIKPGIITCHKDKWTCRPIISKVTSIQSDATSLQTVYPGGLIALGLDCDPAICKNNNLLGNKIYKLDKSNIDDLTKCDDLAIDFLIKIEYLKSMSKAESDSIKEIYLLINSSPIKGTVISKINFQNADGSSNDIYRVVAEKPFAFDSSKISILHKTAVSIELFATGSDIKLNDSKSKMKIKLISKSDLDELKIVLVESYPTIEIVNDGEICTNLETQNVSTNIKANIMNYVKPKIVFKMTLPQPEFKVEPTRFDWLNAGRMIEKFHLKLNPELKCEINQSGIKWRCFGKLIVKFFNYEYMSDEGLADFHNGHIILHIKRNTKNKPQAVISRFIKNYYMCPKCNSLSSRIGKIGSQNSSICVLCDNRVLIHDDWIK
jgi:small GTP-binding protein